MRKVSDNVKLLVASGNISGFILVKMAGIFLHTTLPYDINIAGLGYFSANNNLIAFDAPRQSSVVDRETYKISYTDPTFEFREIFHKGVVGTPVSTYIGFMNTTEDILGDALPGQPLLNLEDILITYIGTIDSHGYSTTEDNAVIVVFECSSPMANLGISKPFFTSQDSLKQVNPNDTAFDQVYIGSREVNHLWGKA